MPNLKQATNSALTTSDCRSGSRSNTPRAVGRECLPAAADRVPPMAVVAAGLGKLIDELGLAAGTIHGSQGARFERPIVAGEKLSATAVLRGNSVRRGARFATLDTTFTDADGEVVATATSMVIVSP